MAEGDKHYAGKISGAVLRRNLKDFATEGNWSAKDSWIGKDQVYTLTAVFKADDTISHFELTPAEEELPRFRTSREMLKEAEEVDVVSAGKQKA